MTQLVLEQEQYQIRFVEYERKKSRTSAVTQKVKLWATVLIVYVSAGSTHDLVSS